jgi:hypothetical protein
MTVYENILIHAINNDDRDFTIMGKILTTFNIDYISTTDKILIMKDINYMRERISKGLFIPSGFMRWKTD